MTNDELAFTVLLTGSLLLFLVTSVAGMVARRRDARRASRLDEAIQAERWWPFVAVEDPTEDPAPQGKWAFVDRSGRLYPVPAPTLREERIDVPREGVVRPHSECFDAWADGHGHRVHATCRAAIEAQARAS